MVASGPVEDVVTSGNVSAAFAHPIDVERRDGRWSARARRLADRSLQPAGV